jgi:opacity protein-like surface antigen
MHLNRMRPSLTPLLRSALFLFAFGIATTSFAGVHFSLSGSHSKSNTGYQAIEAGALSAGLAFDIGQYIRLGYTHMQQLQASEGYACEENDPTNSVPDGNGGYSQCPTFQSLSHIIGHSVELTLILYAGDVMTPYITMGAGPRNYKIVSKKGDSPEETDTGGGPAMNGAIGVSFKINQKFSLKLSYAMTAGTKKVPAFPAEEKAKSTVDGSASIGLQYSL